MIQRLDRPPSIRTFPTERLTYVLIVLLNLLAVGYLPANDIRWTQLSVPNHGSDRFRNDKVVALRAFAWSNSQAKGNYDVTLTDERGGMIRVDTATGIHWELIPRPFNRRKPDENMPFFELVTSERKEGYVGRVYFPRGGDPILYEVRGGSAIFNSVVPVPIRGGFRGVMTGKTSGNYSVYQFRCDRRLGSIQTTFVNLGEFAPDVVQIASRSPNKNGDGRFEYHGRHVNTDRYWLLQGGYPRKILCWDFDRQNSVLPGAFDSLHKGWDELAAFPVFSSNAIVIICDDGLIAYDGRKRLLPFPPGWKPMDRVDWLKVFNGGTRVKTLMKGPDNQRELWDIDCEGLNIVHKQPLHSAEYDSSFDVQSGRLVVQTTKKNGDLLLFESRSGRAGPTLVGRTSPLTHVVGSAEHWCLSDDGKMIFFLAASDDEDSLRLGQLPVEALRFKTTESAVPIGFGFGSFSHEELSFEERPTGATPVIAGILPKAESWLRLSPNDRWVVGNGESGEHSNDLQLFDTLNRKLHFLPGLADGAVTFSEDACLLSVVRNGQVQVWNLAGLRPFLVASTDQLPRATRKELLSRLGTPRGDACFVSSDSVAITTSRGSVRFAINGPHLELIQKSDLNSRHVAFSTDGFHLAVWKDDGAIWRYEWTGENWKGVSKIKVPHFDRRTHGRSRFHSMSPAGDRLAIYSSSGLTIWKDLRRIGEQPASTVGKQPNLLGRSTLIDWAAVSQSREWIACVKELDDGCELTLLDRTLKETAKVHLPFQFDHGGGSKTLLVANDGRHALVRDEYHRMYVVRLRER